MASRKIFRHFLHANYFMFILLISNHTIFLVQFGTNLHLRVFQLFDHSCKLIGHIRILGIGLELA